LGKQSEDDGGTNEGSAIDDGGPKEGNKVGLSADKNDDDPCWN